MKSPADMSEEEIYRELKFLDSLQGISVDNLLDGSFPLEITDDFSVTARGEMFATDKQGTIAKIVDDVYQERVTVRAAEKQAKLALEACTDPAEKKILDNKVIMLYNEQVGIKILINSLYGAFSNQYFRFYDERIAESITLTGQLTIKWIERELNQFFNNLLGSEGIDYIIAIDTDSVYINFDEFVRQKTDTEMTKEQIVGVIDNFSEHVIQPLMDATYETLRAKLNAPRQEMVMKREDIADKAIWTGKKRYILQVLNSEGVQYKEPRIKIKGIECVKSSTPMICRNMIKDSIKIILNEDEKRTQEYIQECYSKFLQSPVEDVAFPRGVSQLDKYISYNSLYEKGTPIHVRAAILHNHYLRKFELDSKYQAINAGDKIKFVYLKMPNTIRENVIGFIDVLPEEFNLHQYIDYDLQFEKAFVAPVQTILDTVKWSWKYKTPINTLDKFLVRRKT